MARVSGRVPSRGVARVRLDSLLAERGLFASRSRAAAAVLAGEVLVGEGRRGLDVGASTGGFTDCLLQRGAAHVVAVDVAYGELDLRLREDARVTVLERVNARSLEPGLLPYRPDLAAVDVSFISLEKVLPAVLGCCAPAFDCLALVKPQFEVGRERVGRGGVVREAALRQEAVEGVAAAARALGACVLGTAPSRLAGPAGNRETFLWLAEGSRGAGLPAGEIAAW